MSYAPVCVDASLITRLVIPPDDSNRIGGLWRRWKSEERQIIAPALLLYEISNALHQYTRHGLLSDDEVKEVLESIVLLDIEIFENITIHLGAIEIARQMGLKATYDAHYLALAQQMNAEFWTTDARLVNAVGKTLSWVHLA